jgi:hypothetical protein
MTRIIFFVMACLVGTTRIATAETFTCPYGSGELANISAEKPPLCSKNFQFSGSCNGAELISPLRQPWLPVDINIVGVTLAFNIMAADAVNGYAVAGNNSDPDVMAWVLANGVKDTWYPPGYAFRFNGAGPKAQYIDAHVWCVPSGAAFILFETVYYLAPTASEVQAALKPAATGQ